MSRSGGYTREGISRSRATAVIEANVVRARVEAIDFSRIKPVHMQVGWAVFVHSDVPERVTWTDAVAKHVVLNPATWTTICHSSAAQAEVLAMARWESGLRFLALDTGAFADAVREEASRQPIMSEVDVLAQLEADANRLLTMASGVSGRPDVLQTQLFMQSLADLQRRSQAYQGRLDKVQALIDTASEAVLGATS